MSCHYNFYKSIWQCQETEKCYFLDIAILLLKIYLKKLMSKKKEQCIQAYIKPPILQTVMNNHLIDQVPVL